MFVEPSKHGHQICLNAQMRTPILHLWTSETFLKSASQRHQVVISTAYSRNMLDQLNLSKRCMSDCQVFLLLLDSAASMFKIWHLAYLRLLYIISCQFTAIRKTCFFFHKSMEMTAGTKIPPSHEDLIFVEIMIFTCKLCSRNSPIHLRKNDLFYISH